MEEEDFEDVAAKSWGNWTTDYLDSLDTSKYPFPNTLWHVKPPKELALKTVFMLIIGLLGLFLNTVILVIISRNRWLWTPSNYLIGNMALVDLLTLLFCPWFMLVRDFYQNYVLKNFGCRFEGFLQASLLLAGVGAVMLVSYDRLAAAALTAEARVTKRSAPKLIVASWVVAAGLALPWAIKRNYVERQWLDHLETYCVEDVRVLGIYWHFTLCFLVWIPLGVMVLTYGAIMWRLECSARKLSSRGGGRSIARVKSRAMRITACVLAAGVVCRVPYTALIYWRNNLDYEINAVEGSFSTLWFLANYLMYTNCAVNPLVYGFTNPRFRRAMDRTKPLACFRFGKWCCVCIACKTKKLDLDDKNTEKIFVITPRGERRLGRALKHLLHINKDSLELSHRRDELTAKPTRCTPLRPERV